MKLYMAPLEEVTGYVYRNAYHAYFAPMDKYFAPFIAAKQNRGKLFNYKEKNDILPEHNKNMYLVPQILTNNSEDFIRTVKGLENFGYREINLNLGCPSKPVVNGGRGSGFLEYRERLDRFLDEIYQRSDIQISIKTRVGRYEPEEIGPLMEIFNRYPLKELIIHPRVQMDLYRGTPRLEAFSAAYQKRKQPLCYNGDIFQVEDFERLVKDFPQIDSVMLGRGLLADPTLAGKIRENMKPEKSVKKQEETWAVWNGFLNRILEDYQRVSVNEEKALFKLKEIWCYLRYSFPKSDVWEKKIKRAQCLQDYEDGIKYLQDSYPGEPGGSFGKK